MERLQKFLSRAGIASRRHAEELIATGKVEVNGKVTTQMGVKIDPAQDKVRVAGKAVHLDKDFHYYAYYKPRGIVVTKQDELGRKGIFAQLKLPPAVNAVGRLDKESEGLLLLTDDGDFLHRFTHPSFGVAKVYHVEVNRLPDRNERELLKRGIPLEGKLAKVTRIKPIKKDSGHWLELELREGMKREIRYLLEAFRIKVRTLVRVRHGGVKVEDLAPGKLRKLNSRPHIPRTLRIKN